MGTELEEEDPRPPPRKPLYFHESAGALIVEEGRCLVLRRDDREEWVMPKGHMEQGERPEDAAVREVAEETGLDIAILAPIAPTRYTFGPDEGHRKRVHWFLAERTGGRLALEPIFAEARWVTPETARSLLTHESDRVIVARGFEILEQDRHGATTHRP
jgi:8-oxo-dGTP pyrophosphatase MutT (NUDIX family)